MTVDRWLLREFTGPFLVGWLLLTAVFAAFVAAGVLADAAVGELSATALWRIVLLRCVIAAEVIVPTALFFAVLFVFERLNRDRELVALLAGGFSRLRLLLPVALLSLFVFVLVAALALLARPWAYRTTYLLEELSSRPTVTAMQAGSFYRLGGDLVVTANEIEEGSGRLRDVFARQNDGASLRLIRAEAARVSEADEQGAQIVEFVDGQALTVVLDRVEGDRRHRFDTLRYHWVPEDFGRRARNRRARTTADLMTSDVPRDVAERQWRFTLPFLTLGMTLVAGALGMMAVGRITAFRMVTSIVAYVAVFNVAAGARSAVENGNLPEMPGIFWLPLVPALLIVVVLALARTRT